MALLDTIANTLLFLLNTITWLPSEGMTEQYELIAIWLQEQAGCAFPGTMLPELTLHSMSGYALIIGLYMVQNNKQSILLHKNELM